MVYFICSEEDSLFQLFVEKQNRAFSSKEPNVIIIVAVIYVKYHSRSYVVLINGYNYTRISFFVYVFNIYMYIILSKIKKLI